MSKILITAGDINGVGPEVAIKALALHGFPEDVSFELYGSKRVLNDLLKKLNMTFKVPVKIFETDISAKQNSVEYGKPTALSGEIAFKSLEIALNNLKGSEDSALVTAPISKKALNLAGYNYSGHTEILQDNYRASKAQMLFAADQAKLLLLTRHVPMKDLPGLIKKDFIINNVLQLSENLRANFGLYNPKIAILGLNPHCGEAGTIGVEEIEEIIPAVEGLKRRNVNVYGPFSPDGFWKTYQNYDCILALYHDQGLIPFKLLYNENLVNITLGLPIVRTSPCHGTAYDIAGKFIACEKSMFSAINIAISLIKFRKAGAG